MNAQVEQSRAPIATAIAMKIISTSDVLGYDPRAEVDRYRGACQGERDIVAKYAGQHPPPAETWSLALRIVETVVKVRERKPDPFDGLDAE